MSILISDNSLVKFFDIIAIANYEKSLEYYIL